MSSVLSLLNSMPWALDFRQEHLECRIHVNEGRNEVALPVFKGLAWEQGHGGTSRSIKRAEIDKIME